MISVVCVYNDKTILDEYLLKSLQSQTNEYEVILMDNTQGVLESAAKALNLGGAKAKGEYIMFVHQDVDLCSDSWLEDAERLMVSMPLFGIAGVAGMSARGRENKERGRSIIRHGEDRRLWEWGNPIQEPEKIQTLDECLIIISKSVFNVLQFDEKTCNGWHLWAVDYCLSIWERLSLDVYVIPMFIYHKSRGGSNKTKLQILRSFDPYPRGYYQTLCKVCQKHKNYYKHIYTSCGDYSTSLPLILQRFRYLAKGGLRLLKGKSRKVSKK